MKCVQDSELPEPMKSGKELRVRQGGCGFKIQVTNKSTKAEYTITLLRDGGIALASFAAPAIMAFVLF